MFCYECGNKLKENAKFCNQCGAKVKREEQEREEESFLEQKVEEIEILEEVKEEAKEEKESTEKNEITPKEKKSKKKPFVVLLVLFLIGLLGVGGYFFYQKQFKKKKIDVSWGNKYYVYLKEINENEKNEEAGLPKKLEDATIGFYEIKDLKDPIMVIRYKKNDENYANIYYLEEDKVNSLVYQDAVEIEYLYNIEDKTYDYYTHVEEEGSDTYKRIQDEIKEQEEGTKQEDHVYTFQESDQEIVINDDDEELSLSKFDEMFIEVETKEKEVSFDNDMKEKEIKEAVNKTIEQYQSEEEIQKQAEKAVQKKVQELEERQEEIKKAFGDKVLTCTYNESSTLDYAATVSIGFVDNKAKNARMSLTFDFSEMSEMLSIEEAYQKLKEQYEEIESDDLKVNIGTQDNKITMLLQGRISELSDYIGTTDDLSGSSYSQAKQDAEKSGFRCK